jgi:hypothetical protein
LKRIPIFFTAMAVGWALAQPCPAEPFRNIVALEMKENSNPAQDGPRKLTREGCVLAGVRICYGEFVYGLAPLFAPVQPDGSLGSPTEGDFVGENRVDATGMTLVKSGCVVVGFKVRGGWVVDNLSIIWKKWDAAARSPTGDEIVSKGYGGTGGEEFPSNAPKASFAIGLSAYSASLNAETFLGGIGLIAANYLRETGAAAASQEQTTFPPGQLDGPRWKDPRYAVVISEKTYSDASWRKVAETLRAKYDGRIFRYKTDISELRNVLSDYYAHYVCFVCRYQEAKPDFIVSAHRFMRELDADPYTDAVWAVLTGLDAADAYRVAADDAELVVDNGLGGMLNWVNRVPEGRAFWEGADGPGRQWIKEKGKALKETKKTRENHGYDLVEILNGNSVDAFWTSGHANRNIWKVFYPDGPASFKSSNGSLIAELDGEIRSIKTDNPKIFLGAGNCLIGCIDGPDAMTLAWIRSGGARQFFGYIVETYYGFMGWGTGDYFLNTREQLDFAESWYAANQCEKALLESRIAGGSDRTAMEYELDNTALYGDPAWVAKVGRDDALGQPWWVTSIEEKAGSGNRVAYAVRVEYRSTVGNGRPKDMRPFFTFLPGRLKNPRVVRESGPIREAVVADNFAILLLNGDSIPKGTVAEIVVEGERAD